MPSILDDQTIELPCPNCGAEHPKTIGWMKTHDTISCACGTTINLDKSDLLRGLAEVDRAMSDIEHAVDRMPKKITLKM